MKVSVTRYMGTEPSVPLSVDTSDICLVQRAATDTGFGTLLSTRTEELIPLVDDFDTLVAELDQHGCLRGLGPNGIGRRGFALDAE